jgi:hypothetical protein
MTWAFAAATCTACCIVVAMAAEGPEVLHEFTLKEHFGVNHAMGRQHGVEVRSHVISPSGLQFSGRGVHKGAV